MFCTIHMNAQCACFAPREIKTFEQARTILQSGKASAEEWQDCANVLVECGDLDGASDCLVFAVENVRTSRIYDPSFHRIIGEYVGIRAEKFASMSTSRAFVWNLLEDLRSLQKSARLSKRHRFVSRLDSEIAELLILASDSSRFAKTRLAAKFRKRRPGESKVRWNRPGIAMKIVNEVLTENPNNNFALNTRAAIHRDVGNLTDALADAGASLTVNEEHAATHSLLASLFLDLEDLDPAWHHAMRAFEIQPNTIAAAQLWLCFSYCIKARHTPPEFVYLEDLRELVERLQPESKESRTAVQIAVVKMLCSRGAFLQALQSLAEFHRESWGGRTSYWEDFIRKEAHLSNPKLHLPKLEESLSVTEDYFPDPPEEV